MANRPRGVSVVAIFLFAATIIAFVVGSSVLFPGTLLDRLWKLNPPAHACFRSSGQDIGGIALFAGCRYCRNRGRPTPGQEVGRSHAVYYQCSG